MRIRNIKNSQEILDNCDYLITNPKDYIGNYQQLFNNSNPIYLEIGMGKGQFLLNMALKYPNINFIGVEKMSSILARAIKKIDEYNLDNLKIIRSDALELNEIFDHEIDRLFLNFSDPWPKSRHASRRLTSHIFLNIYDSIFKEENVIVQKTDNDGLFESSIVSLSTYGYTIEDISLDLHSTDIDNVETEYEEKFSQIGVKIKYLCAKKK